MSQKKVIQTPQAPEAIGPYSQAVLVDGWLFASGQIPLDPKTKQVISGSISDQTVRVMENLKGVLEAAGASFQHVVKTTVYLADLNDFAAMNEHYAQYFKENPPARATVQVARLPRDVKVEIDLIARIG